MSDYSGERLDARLYTSLFGNWGPDARAQAMT
jgi:hypothetical protein